MCGVMFRSTPAWRTLSLIRFHNVTRENAVPRRVMKMFDGVLRPTSLGRPVLR